MSKKTAQNNLNYNYVNQNIIFSNEINKTKSDIGEKQETPRFHNNRQLARTPQNAQDGIPA